MSLMIDDIINNVKELKKQMQEIVVLNEQKRKIEKAYVNIARNAYIRSNCDNRMSDETYMRTAMSAPRTFDSAISYIQTHGGPISEIRGSILMNKYQNCVERIDSIQQTFENLLSSQQENAEEIIETIDCAINGGLLSQCDIDDLNDYKDLIEEGVGIEQNQNEIVRE